MKKTALILILVLILPVFQANAAKSSLKDVTVAKLYEYAKSLYDRGDLEQSRQVMGRILEIDPTYRSALGYKIKPKAAAPCCAVEQIAKPVVIALPLDPNADLKDAFAQEDQSIQVLTQELGQLRSETRVSHE